VIVTDRRRSWPKHKRSGPLSTRVPAGNYSFAQLRTFHARAIFHIYAKTTAALVKEACRHIPMRINKSQSSCDPRRYASIRTAPPRLTERVSLGCKINRLRARCALSFNCHLTVTARSSIVTLLSYATQLQRFGWREYGGRSTFNAASPLPKLRCARQRVVASHSQC
jgi:hypothetical protein